MVTPKWTWPKCIEGYGVRPSLSLLSSHSNVLRVLVTRLRSSTPQHVLSGARRLQRMSSCWEETRSVHLKQSWWTMNKQRNLSHGATGRGEDLKWLSKHYYFWMCSDLVCNVIWSVLKDYDEMTNVPVLKSGNRVVCGGASLSVVLKINYSISFNASPRLNSYRLNLSFKDKKMYLDTQPHSFTLSILHETMSWRKKKPGQMTTVEYCRIKWNLWTYCTSHLIYLIDCYRHWSN